jgi:hypothetical protein
VCDSLVLKIPKNNFQSICTRYYRCWYIFYIFFCQTSWSLTLTILRMERVIRQRGYICAIVHYNGHSMEVHLYIPNNVAKFSFKFSIWKEHFSLCAEMMFFCVRRVQTNTVQNSSSPIFKKYTVFEWKIAQRYQSFGVCFSPQFMRMWCARYSYWINLLVIFLPFWSSDFLGLSCIWFGLMNELVRSRSDPFPRICGSYQRPEDKCMFWLVSPYQI